VDYRFVASLPDNERRLIVDLVRLLEARFIDRDEPAGRPRPRFLEELDDEEDA
jgi:hypothetical protein